MLGLSIFPPLLKHNGQPVRQQQPLEHNHLYNSIINNSSSNSIVLHNESVSGGEQQQHDDGEEEEEEEEWLNQQHSSIESLTDFNANSNKTAEEEEETVTEDLDNLTPEALRLNRKGYVAYVPIPLNDDDHPIVNGRGDWMRTTTGEEVVRTGGYDRRRPGDINDQNNKLLLPIVIVPNDDNDDGDDDHDSTIRANSYFNGKNRQFDDQHNDDYHSTTNLGSIPYPTSNQHIVRRPLNSQEELLEDDMAESDDNLFRMFGTLAPEQRQGRPRNGGGNNNNRNRDDYGQRARLPPQPRRGGGGFQQINRQRRPNGKGRRRGGGGPSRRPPSSLSPPSADSPILQQPPHRIISRYPQNNWGPAVDFTDQRRPEKGRGQTKPLYSYPSDAMSIQDIIK